MLANLSSFNKIRIITLNFLEEAGSWKCVSQLMWDTACLGLVLVRRTDISRHKLKLGLGKLLCKLTGYTGSPIPSYHHYTGCPKKLF